MRRMKKAAAWLLTLALGALKIRTIENTGGIGTEIYTISGLILIVTASAILLKKRKTV